MQDGIDVACNPLGQVERTAPREQFIENVFKDGIVIKFLQQQAGVRKIALIGNYPPRQCGIATFTADLRQALAGQSSGCQCDVIPLDDLEEGYEYPAEVRFEIAEQQIDSYRRAAEYLNFNDYDLVCLQHEFGIFGGDAGSYVLALLRNLRMPVVTTLHTVLDQPTPAQRRVTRQLAELSAALVVMSAKGKQLLCDVYGIAPAQIEVIPHGIPDMPFVDPNFHKDKFGVEGRPMLLTFGLLSPNKGIEHVVRALPEVVENFPDVMYVILGATHPKLVRDQGESYRLELRRLARELKVSRNVAFHDRYVELPELLEFVGAADIYITPYLNAQQVTSGTLAYAFGCGKAVISTPYWHAEELLADGRGELVPFGDSAAIARAVCGLLGEETRRHAMRKQAYLLGREMVWSRVAGRYMELFERARDREFCPAAQTSASTWGVEEAGGLPRPRCDHLLRMTDGVGLLQHAVYSIPRFEEGYCLDDNARALMATVYLEEAGEGSAELQRAATTYAAFVHYALDERSGTWRNFMSFDRRWLEPKGSEDSLGRTVWALGVCVGRSKRRELPGWAAGRFDMALQKILDVESPRAWAYALFGIHEYLKRLDGDRTVRQARETLVRRLMALHARHAGPDWEWFEDVVSYDNARLCEALIVSGQAMGDADVLATGLTTLRWLDVLQQSGEGYFRPVGNRGFYRRGESMPAFDQQPLEAGAMVSAAIAAFGATSETAWRDSAHRALDWFMGRNDLMKPLCDSATGGCRDGLHADRVNQNQGAESTLAWLLALVEMTLFENSLAVLEPLADEAVEPLHRPALTLATLPSATADTH